MDTLWLVLYPILGTWFLWVFYLAVMNLARARDAGTLSTAAYVVGYPVLFVGLLLDLIVNVVVLTPLMIEFPKETTVTSRLKRHSRNGGWRASIANWLGKYILDPFDPSGRHI